MVDHPRGDLLLVVDTVRVAPVLEEDAQICKGSAETVRLDRHLGNRAVVQQVFDTLRRACG